MTFSHYVIEHIPHPWKAIDELSRMTKPGGLALHAVPWSYVAHDHDARLRLVPCGRANLMGRCNDPSLQTPMSLRLPCVPAASRSYAPALPALLRPHGPHAFMAAMLHVPIGLNRYHYHATPDDYFRFSHRGLETLFADRGFKILDLG